MVLLLLVFEPLGLSDDEVRSGAQGGITLLGFEGDVVLCLG